MSLPTRPQGQRICYFVLSYILSICHSRCSINVFWTNAVERCIGDNLIGSSSLCQTVELVQDSEFQYQNGTIQHGMFTRISFPWNGVFENLQNVSFIFSKEKNNVQLLFLKTSVIDCCSSYVPPPFFLLLLPESFQDLFHGYILQCGCFFTLCTLHKCLMILGQEPVPESQAFT